MRSDTFAYCTSGSCVERALVRAAWYLATSVPLALSSRVHSRSKSAIVLTPARASTAASCTAVSFEASRSKTLSEALVMRRRPTSLSACSWVAGVPSSAARSPSVASPLKARRAWLASSACGPPSWAISASRAVWPPIFPAARMAAAASSPLFEPIMATTTSICEAAW